MPTPPSPHTYHCLCSTLLLATPYALSSLPRRAPPSLDAAYILPLPSLSPPPLSTLSPHSPPPPLANPTHAQNDPQPSQAAANILPSLLTPNLRPARKTVVVRREDGFEKRRVLRCGRCGVGVGYEISGEGAKGREGERVVYLLEGGLVETGELGG